MSDDEASVFTTLAKERYVKGKLSDEEEEEEEEYIPTTETPPTYWKERIHSMSAVGQI